MVIKYVNIRYVQYVHQQKVQESASGDQDIT